LKVTRTRQVWGVCEVGWDSQTISAGPFISTRFTGFGVNPVNDRNQGAYKAGFVQGSTEMGSISRKTGVTPDPPGPRPDIHARACLLVVLQLRTTNSTPWRAIIGLGRHLQDREPFRHAYGEHGNRATGWKWVKPTTHKETCLALPPY